MNKEKSDAYKRLITEVKEDYNNNKHPRIIKIQKKHKTEEIELKWFSACEEINLWTYWQGLGYAEKTPEIDILLVGQDWGNPEPRVNPSKTVENIRKINEEIKKGKEPISYLQGVDMERRDAQTDYNLIQIFKEVKGYDIENKRYSDLFFTNFSLGYRTGSGSGGMTPEVMKEDKDYFVELCNILQPKRILCLGRITYEAVMSAFGQEPIKEDKYNDMIEYYHAAEVDCKGKMARIYAVAHCGYWGTRNRGDIPKTKRRKEDLSNQIRDWKAILSEYGIFYNKYHEMILKEFGYTLDEALLLSDEEQEKIADGSLKYLGDKNIELSKAADDIRDILGHWEVGQRSDY